MTTEERNLITDLFDRLAAAKSQPRDPEVEALIRSKLAENDTAPYYLVQTALVFQQAAKGAQARITSLEQELAQVRSQGTSQPASFLSGIGSVFDMKRDEPTRPAPTPPPLPPQVSPYAPTPAPSRGGSFLQTALGTAAGVAGGALLFQGIENMLGHSPGPFGGAATPSGGFLSQTPTENVEIINNYYDDDRPDASTSSNHASDSLAGPDLSNNDVDLYADSQDDLGLGDDSFNAGDDPLNS